MKSLRLLVEHFTKLPGVGQKTAMRLAHHVLFAMRAEDVDAFSAALRDTRASLKLCRVCFSIAEDDLCVVCKNPSRDAKTLFVVPEVRDLLAVEETGMYKGRYHVLGGLISPIQRIGPEKLRIGELKARVEADQVVEVILGTVPTAEGEVTAHYLMDQLRPFGVKLTRIGAGIPVGGSLEYMDAMTVTKAIINRQEMTAGT